MTRDGPAPATPALARYGAAAALAVLMAAGLWLRLSAAEESAGPVRSDALVYDALARNIREGNPYSRNSHPPYYPEYQRPFGYPAFVAAIYAVAGPDPRAVRVVQAMLGTCVIPLAWGLARRLSPPPSRWPALVAAAVVACDPHQIGASALLMREALTSLLVCLVAWAALATWRDARAWRWLFVGLACGVGALVRPEALVMPFAIAATAAYVERRARWSRIVAVAAAVIVPTLLALAPWVWYYRAHFGQWGLGPDEYIGPIQRAAVIYRDADSTTSLGRMFRQYKIRPQGADASGVAFALIDSLRGASGTGFVEAARRGGESAREFIALHPGRWLFQSAEEAVNFSLGYGEVTPFVGRDRQQRFDDLRYRGLWQRGEYGILAAFLFSRFLFGAIVLTGALIATVRWLARPSAGLVLALSVGGVVLLTSLTGTYAPRVRVPYDPLLVTCAVLGWASALHWFRHRGEAGRRASGAV